MLEIQRKLLEQHSGPSQTATVSTSTRPAVTASQMRATSVGDLKALFQQQTPITPSRDATSTHKVAYPVGASPYVYSSLSYCYVYLS